MLPSLACRRRHSDILQYRVFLLGIYTPRCWLRRRRSNQPRQNQRIVEGAHPSSFQSGMNQRWNQLHPIQRHQRRCRCTRRFHLLREHRCCLMVGFQWNFRCQCCLIASAEEESHWWKGLCVLRRSREFQSTEYRQQPQQAHRLHRLYPWKSTGSAMCR